MDTEAFAKTLGTNILELRYIRLSDLDYTTETSQQKLIYQ